MLWVPYAALSHQFVFFEDLYLNVRVYLKKKHRQGEDVDGRRDGAAFRTKAEIDRSC